MSDVATAMSSLFSLCLQVIPRQLCDNAGFDATDMLNKLRQKHALADGSGKVRRMLVHTAVWCRVCFVE